MFYQDLWFWLFVVSVTTTLFLRFGVDPLPWPDRGNIGFFFENEEQRWIFMEAMAIQGWFPDLHTPESSINRVIYMWRGLKLILDVAPAEKLEKMGNPHGFVARQTSKPKEMAESLARYLYLEAGSQSRVEIDHDPDPALREGLLSAVALPGELPYMLVTRGHVLKLKGAKPCPKDWYVRLKKVRDTYR